MSPISQDTKSGQFSPLSFCDVDKAPIAISLAVFLFCVAFLAPAILSVDGGSMLLVSESLVERHSFALPASSPYAHFIGTIGRGGRLYSGWYPLLSIIAAPLVKAGLVLGHRLHLPSHYVAGVFALLVSCVLIAGCTFATAWLALGLGASPRGAVLAALAFAFGSTAWVYSRDFFADPLLAFVTAGSLCLWIREELGARIGGSVLGGLAVLAKPTGVILGPLASVYLLAKTRSVRTALIPLSGSAGGLFLYFAYNYLRFAHVLRFGQPYALSLWGVPEGAFALLLSPGRGLLWYCPVVVALAGLCIRTLRRLEVLFVLSVAGSYFLIYSSWYMWWGGCCWGPRLLLPALPVLMALTGLLNRKWSRVLVVLTLIGFVVSSPNLISYYQRYCQEMKDAGLSDEAQAWSWAHVPLVGIWGSSYRETADALRAGDLRTMLREVGSSVPSSTADTRGFHVVAIWWWLLPVAGVSRIIGATVTLVLVCLSGLTIAFALRVTSV